MHTQVKSYSSLKENLEWLNQDAILYTVICNVMQKYGVIFSTLNTSEYMPPISVDVYGYVLCVHFSGLLMF